MPNLSFCDPFSEHDIGRNLVKPDTLPKSK